MDWEAFDQFIVELWPAIALGFGLALGMDIVLCITDLFRFRRENDK